MLYYATPKRDNTASTESYTITNTTVVSSLAVRAQPILGWNVQATATPAQNSISSQINTKTVTSFPRRTQSSHTANGSVFVNNSIGNNVKSHELSDGIKAGIGVVITVGTLIIIGFIAWIIILKRKTRSLSAKIEINNQRIESESQSISTPTPQLDDSQINELHHTNSNSSPELDDSQINELHHTNLSELCSESTPSELGAASRASRV